MRWDQATQTVTVTKDGRTTSVVIGRALPGGLGTPIIENSRTYLPIRYIAQMLEINILWDGATRTVTCYS